MITPNFSSAMAGFGYIYLAYLVLVFLEVWFITRKDLVQTSASSGGVKALFYRILAFGNLDMSDDIQESSRKIIKFLAAIGIPIACLLHGYVGFLFGSIKANPWWSTPLMFIIFLLSAIVSGVSVLIFLYFFISWLRRKSLDWACVQTMANLLWGFFIIDVVLELLEVLSISYQQMKDWQALSILLHDKLFVTHYVIQLGICSTIPFIFLGINAIFKPRRAVSGFLVFSSSILLLIQVLAMRWNVVIGGQLMSKSMRGYTSYIPGLFEKEGLLAAITIFTVPFILLWVIDKIVPLFKDEPHLQNVPQNQAQDH
jgi:Ni/Fe-hydrogenase subunit HybB-like protein